MAAWGQIYFIFGIFLTKIILVVCQTTNQPAATTTPTQAPITPAGTPSPVPANTDLGPCTCDLTESSCDVNCCCDDDCSVADRSAFSECYNQGAALNSQMCVTSSIMFKSNTPYTVDQTNPSLFCVVTDNYYERNFYKIPEVANTNAKLKDYLDRFPTETSQLKPVDVYNFKDVTDYKSGGVVYTLYSSDAIGVLGLPRAVNTRICNDENPLGYQIGATYECVRELPVLSGSCQTSKYLNPETFYNGFKVVPSPTIMNPALTFDASNPDSAFNMPLYNDTRLVDVTPVQPSTCIDTAGISSDCPNTTGISVPAYDTATKVCKYAVVEVEYVITHIAKEGIKTVEVKFVQKEIQDTDRPLLQKYKVTWKEANKTPTSVRSGNPGYIVGQPVVAGKLTQNEVSGVVKQAIELVSTSRDQMLTVLASSGTGECRQSSQKRLPVQFGVNLRSGCTFTVNLRTMKDRCQEIQNIATSLLTGNDQANYVATFGNSDVNKVGDWVPILTENKPDSVTGSSTVEGLCFSMVLGMNLEIVYANVGSLANPQPKILGVARVFDTPQDLRYQCYGEYCQPDTLLLNQTFELTSSVTFIDVSEKAVPFFAERPLLAVRLPYDFFYPFTSGGSSFKPQGYLSVLLSILVGLLIFRSSS